MEDDMMEKIEEVYTLLYQCGLGINGIIYSSALIALLTEGAIGSGASKEDFLTDMGKAYDFYNKTDTK